MLDQFKSLIENIEEDQTKDTLVAFEKRQIPGGKCVAKLVSYVELGKQPQRPYKGKEKSPVDMVRLSFELFGEKHTYEIGGENPRSVHDMVHVKLPKLFGSKSNFRKLFNAMTYGRDIKHMAQMLGELFLVDLQVWESGEAGSPEYRRNVSLRSDGVWYVNAPVIQQLDDMGNVTGTKTITVPEDQCIEDVKLFLWDQPTEECWDSLFIDGTYTKTVNGVEEEVSRNFVQNMITDATNFDGSPLNIMLSGLDTGDYAPCSVDTPESEAPAVKEEPVDEVDSALTELGLV